MNDPIELELLPMSDSESEHILERGTLVPPEIEVMENPLAVDAAAEQSLSKRFREEVRERYAHLSVLQRPSLLVLCGLVMLFCLAEMLFLTPMITLTLNKLCEGMIDGSISSDGTANGSDEGVCDMSRVQVTLSYITSVKMVLNGLISMVVAGKMGRLSDRIGRTKVFAYMGIVTILGNIASAFSVSSHVGTHINFIVFSGLIGSLAGGSFALIANINSYITDIIEPKDRTTSMSTVTGIMHGVAGLSPLLGSFLIKMNDGDDMVSVYYALVFLSIYTVVCIFFFKESRHPEAMELSEQTHRKRLDSMASSHSIRLQNTAPTFTNSVKNRLHLLLEQAFEVVSPMKELWLPRSANGTLTARYNVLVLVVVDGFIVFSSIAMMPALILFTTYEYNWKSIEIGYFISLSGLTNALVLAVVSKYVTSLLVRFSPKISHSVDHIDITTIRIATIFLGCSIAVLVFNPKPLRSMVIFTLLRSVSSIAGPVLQSSVVKYYGTNTGEVFGGVALYHTIGMLFCPTIMLKVYGSTVSTRPELFLFMPLGACVLALFGTFFLRVVYISPDGPAKETETAYNSSGSKMGSNSTSNDDIADLQEERDIEEQQSEPAPLLSEERAKTAKIT